VAPSSCVPRWTRTGSWSRSSTKARGFERVLRRRAFDQVGGWGLEIVEDVASRWGVHEGTTHVWFELERSGPRLGAPQRPPD